MRVDGLQLVQFVQSRGINVIQEMEDAGLNGIVFGQLVLFREMQCNDNLIDGSRRIVAATKKLISVAYTGAYETRRTSSIESSEIYAWSLHCLPPLEWDEHFLGIVEVFS